MMRMFVLLTSCCLLAATTAFAQQSSPTAQPSAAPTQQTASSADPDSKITCRPLTHEGGIVLKNACLTQRQWDEVRRDTQQALYQYQQQSLDGSQR